MRFFFHFFFFFVTDEVHQNRNTTIHNNESKHEITLQSSNFSVTETNNLTFSCQSFETTTTQITILEYH
jgi:hypothetical protein